MPFRLRKRRCRQANGKLGNFVIEKQLSEGRWQKVSCHRERSAAEQAKRIREQASKDV